MTWKPALFAVTCAILIIYASFGIGVGLAPYIKTQENIIQALNANGQILQQTVQRLEKLEQETINHGKR